jgi:hypothetical protein
MVHLVGCTIGIYTKTLELLQHAMQKPQKLQLHARYRMLKYREMNTRKLRISNYNALKQYT